MGRIEQLAYSQGASEEVFMMQAGEGVAEVIQHTIARLHLKPHILLLCGSGNNAGDAYVAGKILLDGGFHVKALALAPPAKSSRLCQLHQERFVLAGGKLEIVEESEKIQFSDAALLVDGLLGTGFHGEVQGLLKEVIEKANQSGRPIVSIDIPSGVNGSTGEVGSIAIKATETVFLGLPKTGCFIGKTWNHIGLAHVKDFGLSERYLEMAEEDFQLITPSLIHSYFPKLERTQHKYEAGYVVGLGGSKGMPGAAIMASYASLKAGAGIVRLLHPQGIEAELSGAPYEVIREGYREGDVEPILEAMKRASALFIGPGMGTGSQTVKLLKKLLAAFDKPAVIDADALSLIASESIPLPSNVILTPHTGEMKRLLHEERELTTPELLTKCGEFAAKRGLTLVLKGAPTFIFHQSKVPLVCPRGDPGMATAGSGDVLTGVIAGFLAKTRDPLKAAVLGVYLHALAGEFAAEELTSYCMSAMDITDALPHAFRAFI